jgi:hypothetical protein
MEETASRNSSTYKSKKGSADSAGTAKTKTGKEISDKKKLKVLKNALKEEKMAREEQTIELNLVKKRNNELEKEC